MSFPTPTALLPRLNAAGQWLAPLALRTLLAWEFLESGLEKLHGSNWFADIATRFPFPFSQLPAALNWQLATWLELAGSVALLLGLGTRMVAYVFWVLTIVAIAAVHWPAQWQDLGQLWQGYAITDQGYGNYKLPLIYLVMLLPLLLGGAGPLSMDRLFAAPQPARRAGAAGWGVVLVALCLPLAALLPAFAASACVAGLGLLAVAALHRTAPTASH